MSKYRYIYGSAPFLTVNINTGRTVEKVTGFINEDGTWQEHDGTDGQTDDKKFEIHHWDRYL